MVDHVLRNLNYVCKWMVFDAATTEFFSSLLLPLLRRLERLGRFHELFYIPLPEKPARSEMFKKRFTNDNCLELSDENFNELADKTHGYDKTFESNCYHYKS